MNLTLAKHRRSEKGVCPAPPHRTNDAAPLPDHPPPSQWGETKLSGAVHHMHRHDAPDDEREAQMRFHLIDSETNCRIKNQGMNV
jgi:hypothetical protein